jgi:hypothetical protein
MNNYFSDKTKIRIFFLPKMIESSRKMSDISSHLLS